MWNKHIGSACQIITVHSLLLFMQLILAWKRGFSLCTTWSSSSAIPGSLSTWLYVCSYLGKVRLFFFFCKQIKDAFVCHCQEMHFVWKACRSVMQMFGLCKLYLYIERAFYCTWSDILKCENSLFSMVLTVFCQPIRFFLRHISHHCRRDVLLSDAGNNGSYQSCCGVG